jgi:hypothetical protein
LTRRERITHTGDEDSSDSNSNFLFIIAVGWGEDIEEGEQDRGFETVKSMGKEQKRITADFIQLPCCLMLFDGRGV